MSDKPYTNIPLLHGEDSGQSTVRSSLVLLVDESGDYKHVYTYYIQEIKL